MRTQIVRGRYGSKRSGHAHTKWIAGVSGAALLLPTLIWATTAASAAQADADKPAERHPIAAGVEKHLESPDKPFLLLVEIEVLPGKTEAFLEAAKEPLAKTVKEPGNLAYSLSRVVGELGEEDEEDEDEEAGVAEFHLYEHWKSIDALDAHLKEPYIAAFLGKLGGLLAEEAEIKISVPATP